MLSIDRLRLVSDIHTLTLDTIRLKALLRTRWERPMGEEQRRLVRIRRTLTERLVLLAASRHRLHVVRPPRDHRGDWDAEAHAAAITSRLLPEYTPATTMEHAS